MSYSWGSHGLQHTCLPCPQSPWVYSNSCPLSQWCCLTISSSAACVSFCLQSFSVSEFFLMRSALHIRWPKYWSFSTSPPSEYSGLISFRIDWFDLLAIQGTLQHHSSKASVLWCSAFFMAQLSHLYMTTGKTIAVHLFLYSFSHQNAHVLYADYLCSVACTKKCFLSKRESSQC